MYMYMYICIYEWIAPLSPVLSCLPLSCAFFSPSLLALLGRTPFAPVQGPKRQASKKGSAATVAQSHRHALGTLPFPIAHVVDFVPSHPRNGSNDDGLLHLFLSTLFVPSLSVYRFWAPLFSHLSLSRFKSWCLVSPLSTMSCMSFELLID